MHFKWDWVMKPCRMLGKYGIKIVPGGNTELVIMDVSQQNMPNDSSSKTSSLIILVFNLVINMPLIKPHSQLIKFI